ncbi:collagen alpha-1(I) chain-like [Rissa tridactyla]|uniref:collagen alpha-1(I) chain-like n=1 Tax=Rissa tridactyla TaxID=75485 RepID=UPI0023BA74BF|nr:collagen alpha-1(I) chain-like [Rissa tridactyla]
MESQAREVQHKAPPLLPEASPGVQSRDGGLQGVPLAPPAPGRDGKRGPGSEASGPAAFPLKMRGRNGGQPDQAVRGFARPPGFRALRGERRPLNFVRGGEMESGGQLRRGRAGRNSLPGPTAPCAGGGGGGRCPRRGTSPGGCCSGRRKMGRTAWIC